MGNHFFVSYSRIDAEEFALRLTDELKAGPPSYGVWLDVREMQPGQQDWDRQLVEAIRTCAALLFLMTDDSVRDESGCKPEWVAALRYKKPVIPVRLQAGAELPFRLSSRQFVDFSDSFETGLAQLRKHIAWTSTPAGVLQDLRNRRADAGYEVPRAPSAQRRRIEDELRELDRRIDEQQRLMDSPRAVAERTDERIGAGMERERQPDRPVVAPSRAKFVNSPPMTAPGYFQDRDMETELIGAFLREGGVRMMSVVGRGGVGKTAMVCRLLKALEGGRLPDELGELEVDGIVYLSRLGAHPVDFAHVFSDLCRLLPPDVAEALLQRSRDPHETPAALMRALLERFPVGTSVLLLDNFEDVVDAHGVGLTDSALEEALRTFLRAPEHGVKLIITTRVAPRSLLLEQPGVQRRLNLDEGLPSPFAEDVLRAMDADRSLGIKDAPDRLLAQARERTRGFPRALEALAAILAADRDTTLPELLAATAQLPENVVEALVGEAFNCLDALAQQVMQALAIYTRPVPAVAVDYLLQPHQPAIDSAPVLGRLVNMQFVRRDAGHYYLHQVDRDYALSRITSGEAGERHAYPPPFTQHALRTRGADYFEQTRTPRETWRNLDDLLPQLAEFELRCQAGQYDTAGQVLLDIDFDYLILWGHYKLAVDLHERLQGHLADPSTKSASKGHLGHCYDSLGETRRAIELYEQALAISREIGDRWGEAAWLGSLGDGYAGLGETRRAIELYEQALAISREIGDRRGEAANLGSLGNRYAGLGETRRAIELYEQALAISREIGNRQGEATNLGNLGDGYAGLGETRRAIELYEQALAISREIGDRRGEAANLGSLGDGYVDLGETRRAIELYEQALAITREIGDRQGEAANLGNLGNGYVDLGETRRAIELYEQALAISREIGNRQGEAANLGNLGNRYAGLGETRRAIELYEQALAISREIGDRRGEAANLGSLGNRYVDLGETRRAIELYEQALAITREIGDRRGEATWLDNLGNAHADLGVWGQAARYCEAAVQMADEIGLAQIRSEGRLSLAGVYLQAGELDAAAEIARAPGAYDYVPSTAGLALVLGVVLSRQGYTNAAKQAFTDALQAADALLGRATDNYGALDTKALALCGLALVDDPRRLSEARTIFRAARAITRADGVVRRVLRLFDLLAICDEARILPTVRRAAAGDCV